MEFKEAMRIVNKICNSNGPNCKDCPIKQLDKSNVHLCGHILMTYTDKVEKVLEECKNGVIDENITAFTSPRYCKIYEMEEQR